MNNHIIYRLFKNILKSIFHMYLLLRDSIYCFVILGYYNKSWRFWGLPILSKHKSSIIKIGENFVACSLPKYNTIGVFQKVFIKTVDADSKIIIGNDVRMSGCSISCSLYISLGNNIHIGSGVLITDSDAHSIHPNLRSDSNYAKILPVIIEDNVFVGTRAIILKGVTIGYGSVIGAGSVVTTNIPRMSVAAGNPARVISQISDSENYK